uniref:RNase III domain-containing protein n=1 Tax=Neobodo designis TaxID=312471 RepID=A0A7S1MUT4_NEODS|mmetsp:Transcript_46418/g.143290  ORF Transcript_46418/g.143290 Transcript_46418/m.143290 type:complete len:225 (+) Transcript_46418:99-773(+)
MSGAATFKTATGLLRTLGAQPQPFSMMKPRTRRVEFDIAVPPKWTTEVTQSLARVFNTELAGGRPETVLQAFIDPSYGRGGATLACNTQLASVGDALLALQLDDLVSRHNDLDAVRSGAVAPLATAAARNLVLSDECLGTLANHVWGVGGLVLTGRGVEALGALGAPHRAHRLRTDPVPPDAAARAARALVAAAYLNHDLAFVAAFIQRHVLRPSLALSAAPLQ